MTKTAAETRKANLQLLLESQFDGNQAALARAIGKPATDISRYLTDKKWRRNIGHDTARLIEKKCGKSKGWLDVEHLLVEDPELDRLIREAREEAPRELKAILRAWRAGRSEEN